MKYLDEISPDVALMGAVNTVRREGKKLIGENTDGKGFLLSLREDAGMNPSGRKAVVPGAGGGAARAIAVELALAWAEKITVVNSTAKRGEELTAQLNSRTPVKTSFVTWERDYLVVI